MVARTNFHVLLSASLRLSGLVTIMTGLVAVSPQVQAQVSFSPAVRTDVGGTAYASALGDIDRDGDLDVVGVTSDIDTLFILRNNGNGSFAPQSTVALPTGAAAFGVTLGDIDRDGDLDAITANFATANSSILLNNGNGTFTAPSNLAVVAGQSPRSVTTGDFNRDGTLDVAVCASATGSGGISIFLGNGNGTFAPPTALSVGVSPRFIIATDLNKDGFLDLATANRTSGSISILLGNGNGTFAAATNLTTNAGARSVAAGDLDGDGDLDLAVSNYGTVAVAGTTVSVFKNNGNATFGAKVDYTAADNPISIQLGDMDSDGDLDIVNANYYGGSVSVLRNNGNATFATAQNFTTGTGPQFVNIGDLDLDGDLDLSVANYASYDVAALLNTTVTTPITFGLGTNETWAAGPFFGTRGTFVADVTGDRFADVIAVNDLSTTVRRSDGTFFTLPSNTDGEVWTESGFFGEQGTFVADVTGDGRADIIAVNNSNISIRRSTGTDFAPISAWTANPFFGTVGTYLADVDGDGKADAIAVSPAGIVVRRSTGRSFGSYEAWSTSSFTGTRGIYFADVTGDGKADAIVVNDIGISVRRSTGAAFAQRTESWSGAFFGSQGTFFADLDGDKKIDVLAVNATGTTLRRSTGARFGTLESLSEAFFGNNSTFFGDVDGNGKADAIAVNTGSVTVRRITP